MTTRQFSGKDMTEALRAVRGALGPEALILETRNVQAKDGTRVEITAMREEPGAGQLKEVRQELAELKSMFCWLAPITGQKTVLDELMTQGLSPDIISRLAHDAEGAHGADERGKIRQVLTSLIPIGGDLEVGAEGRSEPLCLIGPTGVGKTTTMVKLTVRLTRQLGGRVGWVNLDNRHITSWEQLGMYAAVLGVPYEVVENGENLRQALQRLSDCDVVLIDTPGISPRDEEGLSNLAQCLQGNPGIKRTLLLSTTTNDRDMRSWVELFGRVEFDSLLFTKVDECNHFGPLINIAVTSGRPVSYITLGQKVVRGLELATPEILAALLLPYERQPSENGFSDLLRGWMPQDARGAKAVPGAVSNFTE